VFCGTNDDGDAVHCTPNAQLCCSQRDDGARTFTCMTSNPTACTFPGSTAIRCDDRTDCPANQVCCGAFSQQTGYRSVQCQATCDGTVVPGLTAVRFCSLKAAVDECAEIGRTCTPSGSLEGYGYCKAP